VNRRLENPLTAEPTDLEIRLRRLEDREAINQLFVDYGAHLDARDFGSYADLFAEDGELRLGPLGKATGRADIKALMEATMAEGSPSSYHLVTSPVVTLQGDAATAQVMWTVIQSDASGRPQIGMIGHHRDKLIRRNGRWMFLLRRGFVDIPAVMP
jgi:uncharacterized protein (TIGR02246 family)